jgi:hypothetical protein
LYDKCAENSKFDSFYQADCENGNTKQLFKFQEVQYNPYPELPIGQVPLNSFFNIKSKVDGKCFNLPNVQNKRLTISNCDGSTSKKFRIGSWDQFYIVNAFGQPSIAVKILENSKIDGAAYVSRLLRNPNSEVGFKILHSSNNYFRFQSVLTGKCITNIGNETLEQKECYLNDNQYFYFERPDAEIPRTLPAPYNVKELPLRTSVWIQGKASNLCFTAKQKYYGQYSLAACNIKDEDQKLTIKKDKGEYLRIYAYERSMVFTINGNNMYDDTRYVNLSINESSSQNWRLERVFENYYIITNENSNRCVTNPKNTKDLLTKSCDGSDIQQFLIIPEANFTQ